MSMDILFYLLFLMNRLLPTTAVHPSMISDNDIVEVYAFLESIPQSASRMNSYYHP